MKKCGIKTVRDNKISKQQEKGVLSEQHNVFLKEQNFQLLNSKSCDSKNPKTYFNQLVLQVRVALGIRTSDLHQLKLDQFQKIESINSLA